MFSARGFMDQRITTILMFRTWGNLEANYLPITPPASSWPSTCTYSIKYPFRSRMFRPGQASCRQTPFTFFPSLLAASILGLRTKSRLLPDFRHGPCNPTICNAWSLPGNRRARRCFYRVSSAISGGPTILFPSGFILVGHCVPANWSVLSGRSYIIRVIRRKRFVRWRSPDNRYYVIAFLCL